VDGLFGASAMKWQQGLAEHTFMYFDEANALLLQHSRLFSGMYISVSWIFNSCKRTIMHTKAHRTSISTSVTNGSSCKFSKTAACLER
jgi:hypothetical protein